MLAIRVIWTILMLWSAGALASSPFLEGDFVGVSGLPDMEIQKHEVTYGQWSALDSKLPKANRTPWEKENCYLGDYVEKGFDHPASCISHFDAEAYIAVLNAEDSNYTYRLPTLEELRQLIHLSLDRLRVDGDVSDERLSKHAWYYPYSYSDSFAHEVCTREPILGLCDVLGSLCEWTSSRPDALTRRCVGDSWRSSVHHIRSAYSPWYTQPGNTHARVSSTGFRLVRVPK